jgi:hypothetical protein
VESAQARVDAAQAELAAYVEAVSAADIGVTAFSAGARRRREELETAREALRAQLTRQPALLGGRAGADMWATLNGYERNALLRSLLRAVIVTRAGGRAGGRGARRPLVDRVRVLAYDADLALPARGARELASGIHTIRLPDFDDLRVLRMPGGEDGLQRRGGV